MDPAFVGALRADRDALDAANTGKHTDNQKGLEATAAIATLLNQANATVTRLHGPIHNKYASDPDKIHAWKQASRVESAPAPPEPAPSRPPHKAETRQAIPQHGRAPPAKFVSKARHPF